MLQHILIYFKFFFHFEEIHRIALAGSQRTKDEDTLQNSKHKSLNCDLSGQLEDISSRTVFLKNLNQEVLTIAP